MAKFRPEVPVRVLAMTAVLLAVSGCLNSQSAAQRPYLVGSFLGPILKKAPHITANDIRPYLAPDSAAEEKLTDGKYLNVSMLNKLFSNVTNPLVTEVVGPYLGRDKRLSGYSIHVHATPNEKIRATYGDRVIDSGSIQVASLELWCERTQCKIENITLMNPFYGDGGVILNSDDMDLWEKYLK